LTTNSKLRFLFITAALVVIICSCNKSQNDVIPNTIVDFTLDINDPQFVNLDIPGGADTVNARTNNWGILAAGFDGNGILIYRGDDAFYAYDRTCPYDYAANGSSIKVKLDFIYAVCPKCKTTYALPANGTPASGVGRYPLKNYRTSFDGRYVRVWNK